MKKKILVVLGMHRSGTSLLSRSLAVLGASHGQCADRWAADNPKGFWEDADVVAFNDGLLAELGMGWFDLDEINPDLFALPFWQVKRTEALALMRTKLAECDCFALKDPRLCRLLPFWQPIWAELELDVRYLLCVRSPAAVMQSLVNRNQFGTGYSAALWIRYLTDALSGLTAENRALVVDYQNILAEPDRVIRQIAKHCSANIDQAALADFIENFISVDLDHGKIASDSPLYFLANSLFEQLHHNTLVCKDQIDVKVLTGFKQLITHYRNEARYSAGLYQPKTWHQVSWGHEQAIFDLNSQIPRLDSDINELQKVNRGEIKRLETLHDESMKTTEGQIGRIDSDIHELIKVNRGEIERLETLHDELMKTTEGQIGHIDSDIHELIKVNRGEINRIDGLLDNVVQAEQQQSKWLTDVSNHLAIIKQHHEDQLADLQSEQADLSATVEQLSLSHADTHQKLLTQLQLTDQLQGILQQQSNRLLHLEASLYWKRRLCKRLLAAGYHRIKPILRPLLPWVPALVAQRVKSILDRRLLATAPIAPVIVSPAVQGEAVNNIFEPQNPILQAALHAANNTFDIIVFPVIDWAFRIQRPQHLARELGAAGHRVFYLTTTFHHSKHAGFVMLDNPAPNVFVCQLNLSGVHPVIYQSLPSGKILARLRESLDMMRSALEIKQSASIIDLPFWHKIADALPANHIIYDCMDYHPGFSTNSDEMHQQEQQLLKDADLVITTAERLSGYIAEQRENKVIRNAAEVEFFSQKTELRLYETSRKVVGYYGAISEWFDLDLVIASAKAYPEWDFLLVGSTFGCDIKAAEKISNIHFTGEVPYADLPGYLNVFDVCTIPFKLVELTLCTNPVKVYEYLAAGKPVVATAMPELLLIEDMLHIGKDYQSYINQLAVAMAESEDQALANHRTQWAQQHDWKNRAKLLESEIINSHPKVSVIVLTYNNLDMTKACLHSIEQYSHYPNLELILVDNASSDGTPEFLREYAGPRNNVIVCLNKDNLGFSAGNNVGLTAATGDYLIILNNDTYVTEGWVQGLLRSLRRHPTVGLVGPVTNNIGNEAKININYSNMDEMQLAARTYTRQHAGEIYPVNAAAFFCVMFSRKVYECVGPMEEAFGVGFFEDDDYCNRVREQGYSVAVVEDVFVHHHLSASFDKLKAGKKQELFERNKVIYEAKWGAWKPHQYRPGVH